MNMTQGKVPIVYTEKLQLLLCQNIVLHTIHSTIIGYSS